MEFGNKYSFVRRLYQLSIGLIQLTLEAANLTRVINSFVKGWKWLFTGCLLQGHTYVTILKRVFWVWLYMKERSIRYYTKGGTKLSKRDALQ